jgi:hypothetical protein
MAGEKRFRTSMFGFEKSDVNSYIEKILKEFDDKLKNKDDEISSLKNLNRDIKQKYEDLCKKAEQINEDRIKIASVLLKAQEKAEVMLEEARADALEEKKKLDAILESEKEKLVDTKQELRNLRNAVLDTLRKFESQLSDISVNETEEV